MRVFNKKDSLIKAISFMALMAAINVILSLIGSFVPVLYVLLIIFMPLTSALVEVLCDDKYFPIYAFGTIGLSIAVTFWNLDFTFFYIVPSVLAGYVFGLMNKKRIPPVWSIIVSSIIQTALTFVCVPLVEQITGRNFINDLASIFYLTGWNEFNDFVLLIFYALSAVQVTLSYLVVSSELKKLGFEKIPIGEIGKNMELIMFGFVATSIGFFFIYKGISYLMLGLSLFFTCFIVAKAIQEKSIKKLIIFVVIICLNIFVFAIFNPMLPDGQFLLIEFTPVCIGIISMISI